MVMRVLLLAALAVGAKSTLGVVNQVDDELNAAAALLAETRAMLDAPRTLKWWSEAKCEALQEEEPPALLRAVRRAQRRGGLVLPASSAAGHDLWIGINNFRQVSEEMAVIAFLTGRRFVNCGRQDRAQSKLLRGSARDKDPFTDRASDVWVRRGWDEALVERVLAPRHAEGAEGNAKTATMSNSEICAVMDRASTREAQLGGAVTELDLRLPKSSSGNERKSLPAWLRFLSEPRIASAAVLTDAVDDGNMDYLFGLDDVGDDATSDASAAALDAVRQFVLRFHRHCLHPQDDVFDAASTIAQDVMLNVASPATSRATGAAPPPPRYHALNVRFKECVSAPVVDCERLGVGRIPSLPFTEHHTGWSTCHTGWSSEDTGWQFQGYKDLCADADATAPFATLLLKDKKATARMERLEPRGALTQVGALRRSGALRRGDVVFVATVKTRDGEFKDLARAAVVDHVVQTLQEDGATVIVGLWGVDARMKAHCGAGAEGTPAWDEARCARVKHALEVAALDSRGMLVDTIILALADRYVGGYPSSLSELALFYARCAAMQRRENDGKESFASDAEEAEEAQRALPLTGLSNWRAWIKLIEANGGHERR